MIKRWMSERVLEAMKYRRGVHLTGARQVGKTTLTKMLALPNSKRFTLDEKMVRIAAEGDPAAFVERVGCDTMIIDEVQKVPDLLDAIKINVDENQSRGQYLLTGSSNLRFSKTIKDSLAGRFETIRLRTLSCGEKNGKRPDFLERAFKREFAASSTGFGKRAVIHEAFVGGYPEQLDLPTNSRRKWFENYVVDILTKDIRDVTEIRKTEVLKDVALWLLARSSQFFTIEELCTRAQISKVTADNYLEALKALYLFDKVPAWTKSDYDRIGKRAKWIASDTGIMANMLKWTEDDVFLDDNKVGKLIESWVYHELAIQAEASGEYVITQYRDKDKREIDFIVENEKDEMLGVEVKAGSASENDFKHLKWFAANLAKHPFTGIVLYSGEHVLRFGEGFYAIPLASLAGL